MFRTVDLFSGAGGLSLGFSNAGFNIVAAFDNWLPAVNFYRRNIPDHPVFLEDLSRKSSIQKVKDFDPYLIIGGPPCQDFSSAGKRDESLGRADLTVAFAKIVKEVSPAWFVMENVDRAEKCRVYQKSISLLSKAGFKISCIVLDASRCGVPQRRRRIFAIGDKEGKSTELQYLLKQDLSDKPTTLRDYFGNSLKIKHYYRHPRSYKRRGIFSIDEPSPTIRGVNRPIPDGYPGHPGDTSIVNDTLRPLTTRERSLIQTFPKDFDLSGNKSDIEQLIGNAVPVKLAEYVARRLVQIILGGKTSILVENFCVSYA